MGGPTVPTPPSICTGGGRENTEITAGGGRIRAAAASPGRFHAGKHASYITACERSSDAGAKFNAPQHVCGGWGGWGENLPERADWNTTEEEGEPPARRTHACVQLRKRRSQKRAGLFNNSCANNSWRTSGWRCLKTLLLQASILKRPRHGRPVG